MASKTGLLGCGCLLLIIIGLAGFWLGTRYGQKVENQIVTDAQKLGTAAQVQTHKLESKIEHAEQAISSFTKNDDTHPADNQENGKKQGRENPSGKHHGGPANLNVDFKI